jgi:hypothetical protein
MLLEVVGRALAAVVVEVGLALAVALPLHPRADHSW